MDAIVSVGTKKSGHLPSRNEKPRSDFMVLIGIFLGFAAFGTLIIGVFWAIWYGFAGSIPQCLGISRFWLDFCSVPLYSAIVLLIIVYLFEQWEFYREEGHDASCLSCLWDLLCDDWINPTLIILFVVDFILSIIWSFALGLAIFAGLALIAGIAYGGYKLLQLVVFVVLFALRLLGFTSASSTEDQN